MRSCGSDDIGSYGHGIVSYRVSYGFVSNSYRRIYRMIVSLAGPNVSDLCRCRCWCKTRFVQSITICSCVGVGVGVSIDDDVG